MKVIFVFKTFTMSIIKFDKFQKNNSLRLLDPAGCVHAGGGVLVICNGLSGHSGWSLKTGWVWFGVINRSRVKVVKKEMRKATEHTERNKKTICNNKLNKWFTFCMWGWLINMMSLLVLTVDGHPFIQIFSVRKHDGHTQVPTAQRGFGVFEQLILMRAFWNILLRLKRLRRTIPTGGHGTKKTFKGKIYPKM